MKKTIKNALMQATNTLFTFIITPLMRWAQENPDAFFFIVIGDKQKTEVAWANTDGLQLNGAYTIGNIPEAAGAFLDIESGVDLFVEENVKNNETGFGEEFQMHIPSKEEAQWVGMDNDD